jgi:hypothetical protein
VCSVFPIAAIDAAAAITTGTTASIAIGSRWQFRGARAPE